MGRRFPRALALGVIAMPTSSLSLSSSLRETSMTNKGTEEIVVVTPQFDVEGTIAGAMVVVSLLCGRGALAPRVEGKISGMSDVPPPLLAICCEVTVRLFLSREVG